MRLHKMQFCSIIVVHFFLHWWCCALYLDSYVRNKTPTWDVVFSDRGTLRLVPMDWAVMMSSSVCPLLPNERWLCCDFLSLLSLWYFTLFNWQQATRSPSVMFNDDAVHSFTITEGRRGGWRQDTRNDTTESKEMREGREINATEMKEKKEEQNK